MHAIISLSISMQSSWVYKMMECLDNRVKQSKRKLKKGASGSPNRKRRRVIPRDELMQR